MLGMHHVDHLSEKEQDQVLLTLVVMKGAKKYSRSKEELAIKWMWYRMDKWLEMFNCKVAMSEALFKATYLGDKVNTENEEKVVPCDFVPLIGNEWPKKMHGIRGVKENVIEMMAKVM